MRLLKIMTTLKCPACGEQFDKLARGGICPNHECRAPLKLVEHEDQYGATERVAEFRKPRDIQAEGDVEHFEMIYNRDNIKVEKSNKNNFIVTFQNRVYFNWIYCPSCESKMFQNNIMNGSLEHKCHKCKAITTYKFQ